MSVPWWWIFAVAFYVGAYGAVVSRDVLRIWPVTVVVIMLGVALVATGARYFLLMQSLRLILSSNRTKVEERSIQLHSYWVPDGFDQEWGVHVGRVVKLRTPVTLAAYQSAPKWEPYWDGMRRLAEHIKQTQACLEALDKADAAMDEAQRIWVGEQIATLTTTNQQLLPDVTDQRAMAIYVRGQLQSHLDGVTTIKNCANHLLVNRRRDRQSWASVLHWVNEATLILEAARELQQH